MTQFPLSEQMKALEHLQEIDLKIDQLKKNKQSLPVALKAQDEALNKQRLLLESKKAAIGEIEKTQRQARAATDINNDRLARSMTRLEAVKNSNEFQAVNKEIEQLKKLNSTLSEQLKKSEADVQAMNAEVAKMTEGFTAAQSAREAQASVFSTDAGKLDSEIATMNEERRKFSSKIEARTLAVYDRIRPARGGMGLVPAVGGRCKGCNMMVPPQLFNEVCKATAVHTCPSCHRILFVPGTAAQAPTS